MATYNWDIEKIIKRRNRVEYLAKIYAEQLEIYNDMIRNYDIKLDYDELEEEYKNMVLKFKETVLPFVSKTQLDLVIGAMKVVKVYDYQLRNFPTTPLKVSNDELVEITRELFKQIPSKQLYNDFLESVNPENMRLMFKYYKRVPTDAYGLTFSNPEEKETYGLIARHNSLSDIITLAHEVGHMIIRKNEGHLFDETQRCIYTETEGLFMDLIFSDLLKRNKFNVKDEFQTTDLTTHIEYIHDVFTINAIDKYTDIFGKTNFKELRRELRSNRITIPVNKRNLDYFIIDEYTEFLNNSSSYLIALDLYYLYKKDPERAIDYFYKIPSLTGENPYKDLEEIDATFHIDGYRNLNNQCKKLLKLKK